MLANFFYLFRSNFFSQFPFFTLFKIRWKSGKVFLSRVEALEIESFFSLLVWLGAFYTLSALRFIGNTSDDSIERADWVC
jgi:hypothetical protein